MKIVTGLKKIGSEELELPGQTISIPKFEDDKGESWCSHLDQFETHTWKLLVDAEGMIRGYTKEADSFSLFEKEISNIVEIEEKDLPENFFGVRMFTSWSWFEDRGVVTRYLSDEEFISSNKRRKGELIEEINKNLQPLLLAEKHGIQEDYEVAEQNRLERLLIQIGRIDLKDRDAVWPDLN